MRDQQSALRSLVIQHQGWRYALGIVGHWDGSGRSFDILCFDTTSVLTLYNTFTTLGHLEHIILYDSRPELPEHRQNHLGGLSPILQESLRGGSQGHLLKEEAPGLRPNRE